MPVTTPTSSTRKDDMKIWLRKHNVSYSDDMRKPELLQLVRQHKPPPNYVIDDVIRSQGHEVLRLPPYHPEFNPIELIWSQLKRIVRGNNTTFRLDHIQRLTNDAFEMIGEDRWRSACDHVDKVIEQMKRHDHYMDNMTEKFVINLTDDTSDDSSTDTASQGSTTDIASEIN